MDYNSSTVPYILIQSRLLIIESHIRCSLACTINCSFQHIILALLLKLIRFVGASSVFSGVRFFLYPRHAAVFPILLKIKCDISLVCVKSSFRFGLFMSYYFLCDFYSSFDVRFTTPYPLQATLFHSLIRLGHLSNYFLIQLFTDLFNVHGPLGSQCTRVLIVLTLGQ